jgi:hypothetical protein
MMTKTQRNFSKKTLKAKNLLRYKSGLLSRQILLISIAVLLSACGEQAALNSPDYFIPPTLSHAATEIPLATPTEIQPTPTEYCENDLSFLEDLTYPDNTEVAPGAVVEKVWLVRNSGTCNWDSNYRVRFVEGTNMEAAMEQALFPARSGGEARIEITFIAPFQTGINYSTWQAYTPDGQPFGDQFYIQIVVNPDLETTETPETGE